MTTDRALLAEYSQHGSEEAFRELVTRYLNLVYSTASRVLGGDGHLAQDVAQVVFGDLARLAGTLPEPVKLGGWLHRRACHVALALRRREHRREQRERRAVEMNTPESGEDASFEQMAPVLDAAINALGRHDRTAILLRFFEGRDLRAVGAALGTSEDAAQKRVARALEKLQGLLRQRGVSASTAALAAWLGAQAVSAAPAGLSLTVASAALASAASGGGITLTLLKLMTLTKLQATAGAAVVAGLGIALVFDHLELQRLRTTNARIEAELAAVQPSPSPVAPGAVPTSGPAPAGPGSPPAAEVARLQGEAATLRPRVAELAGLQAENQRLREVTDEPGDPAEAEFRQQTELRATHLKQWALSFLLFAHDHEDRFPETFEQAAGVQGLERLLEFDTNHFEVVFHGKVQEVTDPGNTLLFRETTSRRSPQGDWVRVYGFVDGHVVPHTEAEEGAFARWEQARILRRAPSGGAEAAP